MYYLAVIYFIVNLARSDFSILRFIFWSLVLSVPFIGIIFYLAFYNPPPPAPMQLRATMNHRGTGGKFIGGPYDKAYSYDEILPDPDNSSEKPAWNISGVLGIGVIVLYFIV